MKVNLGKERKARIEMLPLIDTVFLLLVFFIYGMLSMAVHHSLPVQLPLSSTAKLDKSTFLSVTVKADGSVFLDRQPVTMDSLTDELRARSGGERSRGVLLFADRTVSYQTIFKVLDKIREAGQSHISLQAEVENQ